MKTLLVDGEWNLRRNYNARPNMFSTSGEHCGGVIGFLETVGSVIDKVLPDRVVIMWDGDMSGKFRHDFYPMYKFDHKDWNEEYYYRTEQQIDDEIRQKISCSNQKRHIKNLMENLFIRQVEVEYIEGDDLIALYILKKESDEQIVIYSRDKDYYQLIAENVNVLRPADGIILTIKNFKYYFKYPIENSLLLKCFEGDQSDNIAGVPGIAKKTIMKYFPKFAEEEYTIDRFIHEAADLYANKKLKTFETIIGSRKIIERNSKLMNLKEPYINEEAENEIDIIRECILAKEDGTVDRSLHSAMGTVIKEGYVKYMDRQNYDINKFFLPYQRISSKEKEYTRQVLQG